MSLPLLISSASLCAQAQSNRAQPGKTPDLRTLGDLKKAAEAGDIEAMIRLGTFYLNDLKPDYLEALRWFRRAAEMGNAFAMERLGGMHRDGYGVKQDYQQAMAWYRKAMDGGDLAAIASIGWMHYHGMGIPKNHAEALKWYRKAAEKGGHEGMNNLGHMYRFGLGGVKKDIAKAIDWFRRAAEKENMWALDNLGHIYLGGEGVPADPRKAVACFEKAAEFGAPGSMLARDVSIKTARAWRRTCPRRKSGSSGPPNCTQRECANSGQCIYWASALSLMQKKR
jgi:TPR repeat protein